MSYEEEVLDCQVLDTETERRESSLCLSLSRLLSLTLRAS